MRASVAWIVILVAAPGTARAHHQAGDDPVPRPRRAGSLTSAAGADVEAAAFELAGMSGTYFTLALRGEVAPLPWLSAGGRMPLHHLRLEDGQTTSGPGDAELVAKVMIHGDEHIILTGAIVVEVPTGSTHDGLGSGHVELSPLVSGTLRRDGWLLSGAIADTLSLEGEEDHEHVNFVSPHSRHELRYQLGVGRAVGDQLTLGVIAGGATILESDRRGDTLMVAGARLGWTPSASWRFTVGADVPVTSERRFEWKAMTAAQYVF